MGHEGSGRGVVTPEAVRLEFEAAGVGSRGAALLLDLLLQSAVLMIVGFTGVLVYAEAGPGLPGWVGDTVAVLFAFAVVWGYPVAFETLWRGRTLGKAAMGLRVVTVEGSPVRFRHAAVRATLGIVDFALTSGAAALLSALLSRRHQRLGDLVAGTIVLRERTGAKAPSAVRFSIPAGAESYAATLDPAGLSADDYATVRSFLLRAPHLPDEVRAHLAVRLAGPLAAKLRHLRPGTVPAETFLQCLAARYQQRGISPLGGRPGAIGAGAAAVGDQPMGGSGASRRFRPPA